MKNINLNQIELKKKMCSKYYFYFIHSLVFCLLFTANSENDIQSNNGKNEMVIVEDAKQDDNVHKLDEPIKGKFLLNFKF